MKTLKQGDIKPPETEATQKCPGECPGCPSGEGQAPGYDDSNSHDHKMPDRQVEGGLVGWKLAAAAATSFLLPIGLAIAGSAIAGAGRERRFIGAIAGLIVGVKVAIIVARLFWKNPKKLKKTSDKELR